MYKKRYKAGLVDGANSPALSALSISRSTAQTFNGTPDPRTTFLCIFNVFACFLFVFLKLSTFLFCIFPLSISQSGAQTLNGTVGDEGPLLRKCFAESSAPLVPIVTFEHARREMRKSNWKKWVGRALNYKQIFKY